MLHVQSIVVNNPAFVEMQVATLKKFCQEPYTFTIFNDAKWFPDFTNDNDIQMPLRIRETCERLGVECVDLPDNRDAGTQDHNASDRHVRSSTSVTRHHQDGKRVLMLDSDMFPVTPFDGRGWKEAAIVEQRRGDVDYIWPNLYYLDWIRLRNKEQLKWDIATIRGHRTDSGGASHHWLHSDHGGSVTSMSWLNSMNWSEAQYPSHLDPSLLPFLRNDPRNVDGKFFCEIFDGKFLHYRAGSNWERRDPALHRQQTAELCKVLTALMQK